MQRTLQPELLDSLPPDHPDALHNRRDLRWTNAIVGNHRWLARTLPALLRPGETALELGAGTGELGRKLAARGLAVAGLDRWPRPAEWPAASRWHVDDLREFAGYRDYHGVFGNLIFHQFSDGELAALGARLRAHARVIVAAEPARRRCSQFLFRAIAPLLGANHVTLHDAHVSIAAGFRGDELAHALGLTADDWDIRCATTFIGVYRMIAVKRGTRDEPSVASTHLSSPVILRRNVAVERKIVSAAGSAKRWTATSGRRRAASAGRTRPEVAFHLNPNCTVQAALSMTTCGQTLFSSIA